LSFDFRSTPQFYPGTQRIRLFAERVVREPILFFAVYTVLATPMYMIAPRRWQVAIDIAISVVAVFPFTVRLAGGASKSAWAWYACSGALLLAALIPFNVFSFEPGVILVVPALFCFLMFHRRAPHVLKAFGYMEKPNPALELMYFVMLTGVFMMMSYSLMRASNELRIKLFSTLEYAVLALECLLMYFALFGMMFGVLMRRLLNLRFLLAVPIAVNSIILMFYFLPAAVNHGGLVMAVTSTIVVSIVVQTGMGLVYYFSRSTRVIIFFYVVYYIWYKTLGI
jgi:hypothetical protein